MTDCFFFPTFLVSLSLRDFLEDANSSDTFYAGLKIGKIPKWEWSRERGVKISGYANFFLEPLYFKTSFLGSQLIFVGYTPGISKWKNTGFCFRNDYFGH